MLQKTSRPRSGGCCVTPSDQDVEQAICGSGVYPHMNACMQEDVELAQSPHHDW